MAQLIVAISKVENGTMSISGTVDYDQVIKNRKLWFDTNGIILEETTKVSITYDRSDFCQYLTIDDSFKGDGMHHDGAIVADALVVTKPGHALFLPIADCVGTVFYDDEHSVLMLSHLGRHSLEQQGGIESVAYLVEHFGSNPASLKVWLSPTPNKEAYPIFALENKGTKEALHEQLAKAGIVKENISDNTADTATDSHYYSHSEFLKGNKPEDGRFAMVAMMVEK